jgi:predicted kinase
VTEKLTLVLVVGMPGAGKSTLAAEISRALGWPTIDKDTLKSTLLEEGITNEVAGSVAYQLMYALGRDLLVHQRISVIFDSPDPYLHKIDELVREVQVDLKIILCLAEREVRNQRVAERAGKLSQPVWISTTEGDGRQRYTHFPPDTLMVQTTQPLEEIVKQALDYLQSTG